MALLLFYQSSDLRGFEELQGFQPKVHPAPPSRSKREECSRSTLNPAAFLDYPAQDSAPSRV